MRKLLSATNQPVLVLIFYLALSLLCGKILLSNGITFPLVGDTLGYLEIAEGIMTGEYPRTNGEILPPGYPSFLATVFSLFGINYQVVYLLQFTFLAGTAWCAYLISYRHLAVSPILSLGTGLVVLFWPYFILYSLLVTTEVTYSLLIISTVLLTLEGWRQDDRKFFAGAGILIGIASLTRPVALLLPFWIVGFIILVCLYKKQITRWWKHIVLGIAAFVFTLTPWSFYIHSQTGFFAPVSTHFDSVQRRAMNLTYEPGRDYTDVASVSNTDVITSKLVNIFRFWNPGAGGTQAEYLIEKAPVAKYAILFYKLGFFALLALALLSVFYRHPRLWLLWGVILYAWSLHTVLYPYPRYTLPIIPLMLVLAGYTLSHLLRLRSIPSKLK